MTNKEYLGQAYRIDQRINSKLEQLASHWALATKATAVVSDMPRSATPSVHPMEDVMDNIEALREEINADIDALVDLKRDIMGAIKVLKNPEYQTLLELRYLCYRSWEQVAVDLGYSASHVKRLHGEALKKIVIPER